MSETPEIRTARLWLRPWGESDLEGFLAINADPQVEYLPGPLMRAESDVLAARSELGGQAGEPAIERACARRGWTGPCYGRSQCAQLYSLLAS
ncbi:MAG TPA: hypothetical protein VH877_19570 [Polyangia bacterium]|nr:hypothetical protein [Polyangia bacterium]